MEKNIYETTIPLLKKDLKIIQRADYFNFSLDSLLISEFINFKNNVKSVVDLGTGNAAIPLFISKKTKAKITAVEIQEVSYKLAKRNIEINNLTEQIEIIHDDMKNMLKYFRKNSVDIVVSNPPFFKFNGDINLLNDLDQLSLARHEISIDLDSLVSIASELLKDRGYFYLVHRADRLADILETFRKYNIEPKIIRFCHTTKNKDAKIVLIEALKYGKAGLKILPPLYANKENGEYSDEVQEMFK